MSDKNALEIIAESAATKVTSFMDPTVWGQMKAMAETLRQSGMLPKGLDTVPKILVVMQTGFENGLKPMESFGSLYVVNGSVNYYGKAVTRRFREHGWKIEYKDESAEKVTAVVTNMKNEKEFYTETYTFAEAVKSGYTLDSTGHLKFGWKEGFNRRLKLRYGVLSLIIKSYIPEILGSARGIVEVEEDAQVQEIQDGEVIRDIPVIDPEPESLDAFIEHKKESPLPKPTMPQKVEKVEKRVVSDGRRVLERKYFALLKELGISHDDAKEKFEFESLTTLDENRLIDIVGELSETSRDSKGT